jgi:predicted amidohydrolase
LLACWDLAVPEAFRVLVAQGAKIIIIPAFWTGLGSSPAGLKRNPGFEQMVLQGLVTARAFENTCAIVFTNIGGAEGAGDLGLSQVAMPFSGPLGKPLGGGEGLNVIDVDMDEFEEAEQFYGIRKDINGDSWRYSISDSTTRVDMAPLPPPS